MNAKAVQRWMEANSVREVRRVPTPERGPGTCEWSVSLRCGGPAGYDDTVGAALDRARDANAEWLDQAA
jgi:hypothetical protein